MICTHGMHGRFRLGYGAQFLHVAAAMAGDRTEIDRLVADGADLSLSAGSRSFGIQRDQ